MEFYCPEKDCKAKSDKPYYVNLPPEKYMDENNMADMFCPHCGKTLEKDEPPPK